MNRAVVGFGSNIDPEKNITAARQLVRERFSVLKETAFLKIPAEGTTKQPEFINGAILIETELSQSELKGVLKNFEQLLGRSESMAKGAPRNIDLDIHVWNKEIVDLCFYQWDFLRLFVLELMPDLYYIRNKAGGV